MFLLQLIASENVKNIWQRRLLSALHCKVKQGNKITLQFCWFCCVAARVFLTQPSYFLKSNTYQNKQLTNPWVVIVLTWRQSWFIIIFFLKYLLETMCLDYPIVNILKTKISVNLFYQCSCQLSTLIEIKIYKQVAKNSSQVTWKIK